MLLYSVWKTNWLESFSVTEQLTFKLFVSYCLVYSNQNEETESSKVNFMGCKLKTLFSVNCIFEPVSGLKESEDAIFVKV